MSLQRRSGAELSVRGGSERLRILVMMGTRPEVIKMAPVLAELRRHRALFDPLVVTTAQHRELLEQALHAFRIEPDVDLELMRHDQALEDFAARALPAITALLKERSPDAMLVQGDTSTALAGALAGFYHRVAIGHVEAGLRSGDRRCPFPEEGNRRIIASLADLHFAPTERARQNLLREGIPDESIAVTGNTIVDALQACRHDGPFESEELRNLPLDGKRVLLVTAHRRENHGLRLYAICLALRHLVRSARDLAIVFPMHLNPNVRAVVQEELSGIPNVHLVEPASYSDLLRLMERSRLILSDSGGIQEEAPSLGRPVLIMRDLTERPEVLESGAGKIVGTDTARIVEESLRLLEDEAEYRRMASAPNPFGDGHAAERIVDAIARWFSEGHVGAARHVEERVQQAATGARVDFGRVARPRREQFG